MTNSKNLLSYMMLFFFSIVLIMSCAKDDIINKAESDLFTKKGAIITISNVVGGFFDLFDKDNTSVSFDLGQAGENVTSIDIYKSFNGEPAVLHGTASIGTVSVSLIEAIAGTSAKIEDLKAGDNFVFTFRPTTSSGSYISGKPLQVDMACSSALEGEYSGVSSGQSTDDCCPGTVNASADVTITANGGGTYTISDFSAGLYFAWYGVYGILNPDDRLAVGFKDVCLTVSGSFKEPFGENASLSGTVDGTTGVITYSWENGYGDKGTVTLTPK